MPEPKTYIGDGVYAEYDGFGVWLTTQRESGEHRIYLEPEMLDRIGDYIASWRPTPDQKGSR